MEARRAAASWITRSCCTDRSEVSGAGDGVWDANEVEVGMSSVEMSGSASVETFDD